MMGAMAISGDLPQEQRTRLQRAHERLRTASKELQALVATDPIKGRHAPEPPPPEIMQAARDELRDAYAGVATCHAEVLGWAPD